MLETSIYTLKHTKIIIEIFFILFFSIIATSSYTLTLEEALKLAKENYPVLQAKIKQHDQAKYLYKSSWDLYYPKIFMGYSYQNFFNTSTDLYMNYQPWNKQYSAYVGINYRLFDGGFRSSKAKEAYHGYKQAGADIDISENDLSFYVKQAFYKALASMQILNVQKSTEKIAKRNYDLAKAKRESGLAMLSDVTQATVRYTQARMSTVAAQKDMEKAISELNSIIGLPLDDNNTLEGDFVTSNISYKNDNLQKIALDKRPEIERQNQELGFTMQTIKEQKSDFWPKIDLQLAYNKYDNDASLTEHQAVFYVGMTYDLFNGLGRYYKVSAQKEAMYASQMQLLEVKRKIKLEVNNAYKDVEQAFANYKIARDLVKQSKTNYEQAQGEYKVGKGDIISLLQAEINLADSRIRLIQQKMNYNIALSSLERAAYITN